MREVVVGIINGDRSAPTTTTTPPPTTVPAPPVEPGEPVCDPPVADPGVDADDDLEGNVPEPPAGCADAGAPAGPGETPATDPATVPTP
jgi:hypothetical protein